MAAETGAGAGVRISTFGFAYGFVVAAGADPPPKRIENCPRSFGHPPVDAQGQAEIDGEILQNSPHRRHGMSRDKINVSPIDHIVQNEGSDGEYRYRCQLGKGCQIGQVCRKKQVLHFKTSHGTVRLRA